MRESSISSQEGLDTSNRERDQRLRSAKKKLKSYRAKQAQMEQAKRQSLLANSSIPATNSGSFSSSSQHSQSSFSIPAPSTSQNRLSVQGDRALAAIINDAARESNQFIDNKRHSRSFSRSSVGGHGRGHSRTGSISVTASGLIAASQLLSNNANVPSAPSSNRLSTTSSSSFIASTPHSHTRGHSRSHSRSGSRSLASGRSRPVSLIGSLNAPSSAVNDAWKDVDESATVEQSPDIDMLKTPTLASTSQLMDDSTPMAAASNGPRPFITATPATPINEANRASNDATPVALPNRSSQTHARRSSRHSRKDSVSTRKESMEIMGGLGSLGINPAHISAAFDMTPSNSANSFASSSYNQRNSRRISSQRWSGLQSASVLFGGPADPASKRNSFDWRSAIASAEAQERENNGDDRLTALEKLEGRSKRHSRQSSVQLPTFDELHGDEGMNKRASQDLIESNLKTTNSSGSMLASIPFAAPPSSPSASVNAALNNGAPSLAVNGDLHASVDSSTGGEGLGTLMEEEEEEEDILAALSPLREKGGFDFVATEEERKKRKQAEQEVIKRTRRTSLTPGPLKLSGRPASLFLSPRTPQSSSTGSGFTPSNSMPTFASMQQQIQSDSNDADISQDTSSDSEMLAVTPTIKDIIESPEVVTPQSSGPVMSQMQRKLAEARLTGALPETPTRKVNSGPTVEMKRSWRASMPTAPATAPAVPNAPSSAKGMRTLRLATNLNNSRTELLQHRANAESTSSLSSSASHSSSATTGPASSVAGSFAGTPNKRGSLIYNSSSSNAADVVTPANSGRRSSIQYRASPLDSSSPADLSKSSISSTSSFVNSLNAQQQQQSTSPSPGAGVPYGMFEELKSKHQRDVALLDDARRNIARLESELASESERARNEYDELERWSAEEKRSLGVRIEHLEASIVEVTQVRAAREQHHQAEMKEAMAKHEELKTQLEDAQDEREMLREDVEGWRTRCSDLEKSLRDRQPSPMLSAAIREGSISPIITDFDAPPTPQAIKLLKDMRMQILSLARSLEMEKEQHAKTRTEKDQLNMRNARLLSNLHDQSFNDDTMATTMTADTTMQDDVKEDAEVKHVTIAPPPRSVSAKSNLMTDSSSNGSLNGVITVSCLSNPSPTADRRAVSYESAGSSGSATKKKRNHVFAYDSSMESGKGGTSMGSMSGITHQTSDYLGSPGSGENRNSKNDDAFIAEVQADLVGLGMSTSLDTLDEEEEANVEKDGTPLSTGNEQFDTPQSIHIVQHQPSDSFDVEAGGLRPFDVESTAPSTPALDHQSPLPQSLPTMSIGADEDDHLESGHNSVSITSSVESHMEPVSPLPTQSQTSTETITTPMDHDDHGRFDSSKDEDQYLDEEVDESELPPPPAPRPEFIREWSFSKAMSTMPRSNSLREKPKLRIGTQGLDMMGSEQRKRRARKNVSIDDFFGIMNLDQGTKLPPLPTPDEALDMPPLQFENDTGVTTSFNSAPPYGIAPRWPSTIKPPIAKTSRMYGQSMSSRSSSSLSPSGSFNSIRTSSQSQRYGSSGNHYGGEQVPAAQSAPGGGYFSRVVSLTSAFSSGLGGYLMGGGTPSPQALPAYKNDNRMDYNDGYHGYGGVESGDQNASISWAVTQRREVEEA
ncbi:uncharacterized protein FA14DRAFT_158632 [Meira miltonrushii]|uniref:Uncharacterized protein n=1 Tax=Meira miltonrushii TaxID=1280837 RepID=A0A316V2N8_9BASI|nr:uncharacterized protein FA14DRAFT_158632 [Meira miltonrushii]PWN31819.1 hypothetical protein FA14DRAFT_158632 [Meira miltonrushii]